MAPYFEHPTTVGVAWRSVEMQSMPDDLSKMTVVQLRASLKVRQLPTAGVKAELIGRLQLHQQTTTALPYAPETGVHSPLPLIESPLAVSDPLPFPPDSVRGRTPRRSKGQSSRSKSPPVRAAAPMADLDELKEPDHGPLDPTPPSSAKWASLSQLATRKWALLVVLLVVAGLALTNKGLGGWNAATVLTGAPATATTATAKAVANAGGVVAVAQAEEAASESSAALQRAMEKGQASEERAAALAKELQERTTEWASRTR